MHLYTSSSLPEWSDAFGRGRVVLLDPSPLILGIGLHFTSCTSMRIRTQCRAQLKHREDLRHVSRGLFSLKCPRHHD